MDERTIFLEVLEQEDVTQRAELLNRACGDDLQLRGRVEALLRAHEDAGSFLGRSPEELNWTGHDMTAADWALDSAESWSGFLTPSDKPDVLGTLGACEVIECIGRGGMGIVFRAHEPKLNRTVAIKLLAPELAANALAVQRFVREARAAAAISHDNVVTIHAIDAEATPPMIVMGYVDGQSLQQKIDRVGALDLRSILQIGMQTAAGLAAAHRQGLVHRDIKPANILLENSIERVKISDFGVARAVDAVDLTQTGQISGTPQYMSPEQAEGESVDFRSDLFSLGCVMYAMCTGRAAYRADSALGVMHRIVNDRPEPIRNTQVDVPTWLCAIIDKLLEKDPGQRYQSADEVAELLAQHLVDLQQPDAASPPPRRVADPVDEKVMPSVEKSTPAAAGAGRGVRTSRSRVRRVLLLIALAIPALIGLKIGSELVLPSLVHSIHQAWNPVSGPKTKNKKHVVSRPIHTGQDQALVDSRKREIVGISLSKTWAPTEEPVVDIDISPDGRWLVSGHRPTSKNGTGNTGTGKNGTGKNGTGNLRVWSVPDGQLVRTIPLPAGVRVMDVAFSPDGRAFAWVQDDGHLRVLPTVTSDELPDLGRHPFDPVDIPLRCLAWSPDGSTILTGGEGQNPLSKWDTHRGGRPVNIPCYSDTIRINAIAFSPAGTRFATASSNVAIWSNAAQPPRVIKSLDAGGAYRLTPAPMGWETIKGRGGKVALSGRRSFQSVVFAADGESLYAGHDDRSVYWSRIKADRSAGNARPPLRSYSYGFTGELYPRYAQGSRRSGQSGSSVAGGGSAQGSALVQFEKEPAAVDTDPGEKNGESRRRHHRTEIAVAPSGGLLAVVGFSTNDASPTLIGRLLQYRYATRSREDGFAFRAALGTVAKSVRNTLAAHLAAGRWEASPGSGGLTSLTFTPDGRFVIGGSLDGTIKTWELHFVFRSDAGDEESGGGGASMGGGGDGMQEEDEGPMKGGGGGFMSAMRGAMGSLAGGQSEATGLGGLVNSGPFLAGRSLWGCLMRPPTDINGLVDSRILRREFDALFGQFPRGPDWEVWDVADPENRTASAQDVIAAYRVLWPSFLRVSEQQELSYRDGRFDDAAARIGIANMGQFVSKVRILTNVEVNVSKVSIHLLEQARRGMLSGARAQLAIEIFEVEIQRLAKQLE
jgi:serine/threonine protein kinase